MGCSKLMLPWSGRPILYHVLDAWRRSGVSRVIVVVRGDDTAARNLCEHHGVDVVCPDLPPADMKQSVQHALRHVADAYQPVDDDAWLLAPADLPTLTPDLIDCVLAVSRRHSGIVVPRFGHRRGHPVALPWSLAPEVFALPADAGIDQIVQREAVFDIDLPADAAVNDIDTPEDYQRLRKRG